MVGQHLLAEWQLEEVANLSQHLAGTDQQIFIANFQVMPTAGTDSTRLHDPVSPIFSLRLDIVAGAKPKMTPRESHVAPISNDMDKVRFGQELPNLRHDVSIVRGL